MPAAFDAFNAKLLFGNTPLAFDYVPFGLPQMAQFHLAVHVRIVHLTRNFPHDKMGAVRIRSVVS